MCCPQARPCIIQTGNVTGWGSERVNSELVPTRVVGRSVKALIDSDGAMVRQERLCMLSSAVVSRLEQRGRYMQHCD